MSVKSFRPFALRLSSPLSFAALIFEESKDLDLVIKRGSARGCILEFHLLIRCVENFSAFANPPEDPIALFHRVKFGIPEIHNFKYILKIPEVIEAAKRCIEATGCPSNGK